MNDSLHLTVTKICSAFILMALMSCGNASDQESNEQNRAVAALRALENEVIDVHDEVMPKMAELNNTRVKLLKHYGDEKLSSDKRSDLSSAIMHLEEADSLMWDWMHNFDRPDYEKNLDSVKIYLENEKITVTIMKDQFLASMKEGEALLLKYRGDED